MKKALGIGTLSFVLIYATCILFGSGGQDLARSILQYLFWSLPASVLIGLLVHTGICRKTSL